MKLSELEVIERECWDFAKDLGLVLYVDDYIEIYSEGSFITDFDDWYSCHDFLLPLCEIAHTKNLFDKMVNL